MRTRSLSTRLLASVSLLLVLFFGVTIWVLDGVYRNFSEAFILTRLDLQVANLISASDEEAGGKLIPGETLRETRFANLGSGLYGQIQREDGEVMWWSHSLTATRLELYTEVAPGKRVARRLKLPDGSEVQALSVGLAWEFPRKTTHRFTYTVAEDLAPYRAELRKIREQLFGWFGGLMVLLLGALALLFRWVLKPVRQVEHEIEEIEAGRASELHGQYPRELVGITANMNTLLRSERERLERYRNTLGNLAHSLKTPLAVARSLAESQQLQEQISRMDNIVRYQLKRASMSGGTGLGNAPIEVSGVLAALRETLMKVYAEKRLSLEVVADPGARFVGDEGDLLEIAGNLLDNACKWSRRRVKVSASPLISPTSRREGLLLCVEDDGPGIAPEKREHVLKRGARLDERVSGQGIGLSVVQELAQLSGGAVEIDTSPLGGCKITVRLPAP
jgi:two-component system sensor histidine kinase PhoQ